VEFVQYWSERTGLSQRQLLSSLAVPESTFHSWRNRKGTANRHNGLVPKAHWLTEAEREAIVAYYHAHHAAISYRWREGYRRLSYMMLDDDVVAASPSSVYRVLKKADLIQSWSKSPSRKGKGFDQPLRPHEHWHIDICYVNITGTFYYLCSILDGYSRAILHWELREQMQESDVELVIERARERFADALAAHAKGPRLISDNGPQFIAGEFKKYLREVGMSHVRTSPYYPQSNGKKERYFKTLKGECIRRKTPLSLEEARRVIDQFVDYYNSERLHSAIGYVAPMDKLLGKHVEIMAERKRKLKAAQQARAASYANRLKTAA